MQMINRTIAFGLALVAAQSAFAQEAMIRKNLAVRAPQYAPINEVTKTALPGIYEVRINGNEIIYTDAQANTVFLGQMVDLRAKLNLTNERQSKLGTLAFKDLPFADAITIVKGNGKRKMAVFADPTCPYCKTLSASLEKVTNVTISVFLYPVLGQDAMDKSAAVWCSKNRSKVWTDWMVRSQKIPATEGPCDVAAIQRNLELGRVHAIAGTPTVVFSNDVFIPSGPDAAAIEKALSDAKG